MRWFCYELEDRRGCYGLSGFCVGSTGFLAICHPPTSSSSLEECGGPAIIEFFILRACLAPYYGLIQKSNSLTCSSPCGLLVGCLISQICHKSGQNWVEDPTNVNLKFARNRIRKALKDESLSESQMCAAHFLELLQNDERCPKAFIMMINEHLVSSFRGLYMQPFVS